MHGTQEGKRVLKRSRKKIVEVGEPQSGLDRERYPALSSCGRRRGSTMKAGRPRSRSSETCSRAVANDGRGQGEAFVDQVLCRVLNESWKKGVFLISLLAHGYARWKKREPAPNPPEAYSKMKQIPQAIVPRRANSKNKRSGERER